MIYLALLFLRLTLATAPCHVNGALPDAACTPGVVATVDLQVICQTSTNSRRHVSEATKRRVLEEYGFDVRQPPGAMEIDHLIPLELGGANDIGNLWPESAPLYHEKDALEGELHRRVCSGRMKIEDAQRLIAADWTRALP